MPTPNKYEIIKERKKRRIDAVKEILASSLAVSLEPVLSLKLRLQDKASFLVNLK